MIVKKTFKTSGYFLFTLSLLLVGSIYYVSKVDLFSTCKDEVKTISKSNDGKLTAYLYLGNCGATTDYYTHVNVFKKNEHPETNNAIMHEGEIFGIKGNKNIVMKWDDKNQLFLYIDEKLVHKHEP